MFSNDDLFVGFWEQYSGERINSDGSTRFALSENEVSFRAYIDIKKEKNEYVATYYMVSSSNGDDNVSEYSKRKFKGLLRGGSLLLSLGKNKVTITVNSKNNGKSIESTVRYKRHKIVSMFEKTDESEALDIIKPILFSIEAR